VTDLPTPVVAIPLAGAALCLSCERIYWLAGSNRCPGCTDEHFVMLQGIIGTTIGNETAGPAANEPGH
jgi:hypothetical protein